MKKLLSFIIIFILLLITFISTSFASEENSTLYVNTNCLNVRKGTGKNFDVIEKLNKNSKITLLASLDEWSIIETESGNVGAVNSNYLSSNATSTSKSTISNENTNIQENVTTSSYEEENTKISTNEDSTSISSNTLIGNLSTNELFVFNKVNKIRIENNLKELNFDESIQQIAKQKAKDLSENNYFSHTSPTLGTLNDMLTNNKISFKNSAENIAGNNSIEKAINAWTNSKSNYDVILNSSFTKTGISIVDSKQYGKIIVQLFIE